MLASGISFLTPAYALAATLFVVTAAAVAYSARRAGSARGALGLGSAPRRWLAIDVGLVGLAASLLALACAQPALSRTQTRYSRSQAQVAFVFDVSRSMLAAHRPGAPNRLDRARAVALRIRDAVPDVPVGLLSLTDRPFPLAFPDTDLSLFRDALAQTVGIQEPPPRLLGTQSATDFKSLKQLAIAHYFRRAAKQRAIVVFSDAETEDMSEGLGDAFRKRHIRVYVVRFWHRDERVWAAHGRAETYRPNDAALPAVRRFVKATRGKLYAEDDAGAVASQLQKLSRGSKRVAVGSSREPHPLAPYLLAFAALPLGAWFWRRSR